MSGAGLALAHLTGGDVDRIRQLPHPLFPSMFTPLAVGKQLPIPAQKTYFEDSYMLPVDVEVTSISIWNSQWAVGDYWDLWLGDIHICQKIFTKTVPQTIPMGHLMGLVYPMPANTVVMFKFTNGSGTTKTVGWDVHYLYDQPEGQPPVIP